MAAFKNVKLCDLSYLIFAYYKARLLLSLFRLLSYAPLKLQQCIVDEEIKDGVTTMQSARIIFGPDWLTGA